MTDTAPSPEAIPTTTSVPLPTWTDPASITSYIVSLATLTISILTSVGVVVPAGTSTTVSTWAGVAGIAISAGVVIFNFVRVTILHKAAIVGGASVSLRGARVR